MDFYCQALQCWQNVNEYSMYCNSCYSKIRNCNQLRSSALMYKLLHFSNPNDYAIAVWKDPRISTHDRFEALCGITLIEFVPIEKQILETFNCRTKSQYSTLKNIPVQDILESDMNMMKQKLRNLERSNESYKALADFFQSVCNGIGVLTSKEIMRLVLNVCVYNKQNENDDVRLSLDICRELSEKVPSLQDVQSLDLSPTLFQNVKDILGHDFL